MIVRSTTIKVGDENMSEVKVLTKDNFASTIESDTPTVVDFWASWCGPCNMFKPIFHETAKEYDNVTFGTVSTEEQEEIAMQQGIRSLPTTMIFKSGQKVGEFSGAMPKDMLKQKIDSILQG